MSENNRPGAARDDRVAAVRQRVPFYRLAGVVHLANASYRLGRTLRFDPETEQVIGDDEANLLLRDGDRGYRPPFVVPENV